MISQGCCKASRASVLIVVTKCSEANRRSGWTNHMIISCATRKNWQPFAITLPLIQRTPGLSRTNTRSSLEACCCPNAANDRCVILADRIVCVTSLLRFQRYVTAAALAVDAYQNLFVRFQFFANGHQILCISDRLLVHLLDHVPLAQASFSSSRVGINFCDHRP